MPIIQMLQQTPLGATKTIHEKEFINKANKNEEDEE